MHKQTGVCVWSYHLCCVKVDDSYHSTYQRSFKTDEGSSTGREGPYQVSQVVSPTTFVVIDSTGAIRGKYHASALTPYVGESTAIEHARRRGRPAKSPPGRASDLGGEVIAPRRHHATSRTVRAPPPSRHSARLRARRSSPVPLVKVLFVRAVTCVSLTCCESRVCRGRCFACGRGAAVVTGRWRAGVDAARPAGRAGAANDYLGAQ
ncbi:hypothetical protein RR46_11752 [Papilio xuthus]|uniref:Uncharacterized protein n=1 Tax=Papilio xuthus TaxID=66420 RepID=A0A194PP39_PAPXU|nr:hypothetical protein RR46_11752 [Papilio xuthus]